MGRPKKKCSTCVHYQQSPVRGQGWCRNPALRKPHERSLVGGRELACDKKFYDFWEPIPAKGARTAVVLPSVPRPQVPPVDPVRGGGNPGSGAAGGASRTYLYASGVLVLLLIALGSLLLVSGQEPEPVVQVKTTPSASASASSSAPTPTPTAVVSPTATIPPPSPTPAGPARLVVANTDRMGVYLRKTPAMADRLLAWAEGTVLEVIGPDTEAEGVKWKHVKDPKGNEGWVPAQYVAPKE